MRVSFFSPLPPSKSGIADYSQTLISHLARLADLKTFSAAGDPRESDIALYQVGNNAHHDFVYETALRHPGVVVMHESNLHHLIADITIKRGDWDAYLREVEYDAGAGGSGVRSPGGGSRGWSRLRRRADDPPDSRIRPWGHRTQSVHGRRSTPSRIRRAGRPHSAWRLDTGRGPHGQSGSSGTR